jgi:hypothetical protein
MRVFSHPCLAFKYFITRMLCLSFFPFLGEGVKLAQKLRESNNIRRRPPHPVVWRFSCFNGGFAREGRTWLPTYSVVYTPAAYVDFVDSGGFREYLLSSELLSFSFSLCCPRVREIMTMFQESDSGGQWRGFTLTGKRSRFRTSDLSLYSLSYFCCALSQSNVKILNQT